MGKPHVHAELIKAWADGAEIEELATDNGYYKWKEVKTPIWSSFHQYRIKAEREYPKTTLTDLQLMNAYCANGQDLRGAANAAIKQHIIDEEAKNG